MPALCHAPSLSESCFVSGFSGAIGVTCGTGEGVLTQRHNTRHNESNKQKKTKPGRNLQVIASNGIVLQMLQTTETETYCQARSQSISIRALPAAKHHFIRVGSGLVEPRHSTAFPFALGIPSQDSAVTRCKSVDFLQQGWGQYAPLHAKCTANSGIFFPLRFQRRERAGG